MIRFRTAAFVAMVLVLPLAGCGGKKFQPVKGQLKLPDGSPVKGMAGGEVVFEAVGPDGKTYTATGALDDEGRFTLGTEAVGDGAVTGKHKVLISPPAATGDTPVSRVIHRKYESFETSGLVLEVVAGSNDIPITVEPAPKK